MLKKINKSINILPLLLDCNRFKATCILLVAQQSFILKQITSNSINASTIIYLIILDREIKIAIYCVPFTNHVLQWYWSSKHYVRNTYTTMALVCYIIP